MKHRHRPCPQELFGPAGGTRAGTALLVAAGRRTDLPGIGVGVVGVDASAHTIPVDDHLRVAPGVWAIGDITGHGAFTHMSMYQADIVVHDILGEEVSPAEYHAVPRVTFTDPEIGSVGLTEQQAALRGPVDIYAADFRPMKTAFVGGTRSSVRPAVGVFEALA